MQRGEALPVEHVDLGVRVGVRVRVRVRVRVWVRVKGLGLGQRVNLGRRAKQLLEHCGMVELRGLVRVRARVKG